MKATRGKSVVRVALVAAVVLSGAATAGASTDPVDDVAEFLDSKITELVEELDIPGAAVAVVRGRDVILLHGYGYSDRETSRPVDPDETLFPIGSVTKPITALAVHQQIESGRLTVNDDAADFIGFDLPTMAGSPVTVGSLLTHTSGLENPSLGTSARTSEEIEPLGEYLARSVPGRFAPTGEVHSYSNWGYALLGHLVEEVSGETFSDYVGTHIFGPLEMDSSGFLHAMPTEMSERLATGYSGKAGARRPEGTVSYRRVYPAGGVVSTAADMASFTTALLQGASGVMDPKTASDYSATTYRAASGMPGRTQGGLEERLVNGQRILVQGGDDFRFSAQLMLIPSRDLGVFLVYNTFDDRLRENIASAIAEHLFPGTPDLPRAVQLEAGEIEIYAGTYRWTRYVRGTIEKVVALGPPYNTTVSAATDGTLAVSFIGLDDSWTYVPIGNHTFAKISGEPTVVDGLVVDPGDLIAFTVRDGRAEYLNLSLHTVAAERVPFVLMGIPQLVTLGTTVMLFAVSLLLWPVGALVRAIRRRPHTSGSERRALWIYVVVGVVAVGGLAAFFAGVSSDIVLGVSPQVVLAATLLSLAGIASVILIPTAVLAWKERWFGVSGRILATILALISPLILFWDWYWNVLGYQW